MVKPALRQQIVDAFASAPRPLQDDIAPHMCDECVELANDFASYLATEIPNEIFERHVFDMPLLSANAKHFFLPTWLLYGLQTSNSWLNDAASAVLYALGDAEHRWDSTPPYSLEQWLVIQAWLLFMEQFLDEFDRESFDKAKARVFNEI